MGKLLPLVAALIAVAIMGSVISSDSTTVADLAAEVAKGKKVTVVDVRSPGELAFRRRLNMSAPFRTVPFVTHLLLLLHVFFFQRLFPPLSIFQSAKSSR